MAICCGGRHVTRCSGGRITIVEFPHDCRRGHGRKFLPTPPKKVFPVDRVTCTILTYEEGGLSVEEDGTGLRGPRGRPLC